ncbi:hypothetical protein M9H77_09047 [Catharanthus roseus]|uniref:Uncharacterized protein n=1 Tax=Catharanthus roseus TaxID=4058 RepID=A0ACC0BZF2_CATRO|nr:hypothetical protein M9H77_09047 [Catharanthus roseus]
MADAVVEFLLANLKELLLYHVDLLSGVKDQVESLHRELSLMKAFLKDSREKRSEYEYVRELVRQITDVSYEAEDVIDTFVVIASMQKARSTMKRVLHAYDHSTRMVNVAKQIESIKIKVKEIYDKKMFGIENLYSGEVSRKNSPKKKPVVEVENVVGLNDEANIIVGLLTKGTEHLEVVSIVGMGGLGKTTLAKKVFTHPSIEYHFYNRAWIYMSQEYSRREVFLDILDAMGLRTDQMSKMSDDRLAEELCGHLRSNRYLIVIDDVWTNDAWNDIKMAFPNTSNGSRILLTSRNTEVAKHANPYSDPHQLRFLTVEESWELLCRKVFREGSCLPELEELGRSIAQKCYGLPLAIVVVSGLLSKKPKTRDWWKRVAESVSAYVAKDPEQCMDVLALSYKHLPDHLKVCFIYFGVFPEDFEIPVWRLLRLWVAEGFIQQTGHESVEDTAEEFLEDLVDRNLVLVAKRRANGRIKSCRIHDMLRDLCLREGAVEKFLQVIKGYAPDHSPSSSIPYFRRLCVHSHVLDFISSKPSSPHVRSLLCFDSDERDVPREHTSFTHEGFRLVRILDMRSILFSRFPNEIVQLVHLRLLAIFGRFKVVPSSISNLWNLQTLIVGTTWRSLDIQADIWKMLQFRHLHTSGLSCLHGPRAETRKDNEDPFVRRNIQTICTISPECCKENILARTPNLKKLGIRGKLITLTDLSLFDNLAKLDNLETLKLLNDTFPLHPSQCNIPFLPPSYKFPPNLKKLTLSDTLLEWENMSVLGMLPNLEVLKLKDHAFKGSRWEPLDGGFRLLRVLQLGRSDLVYWHASAHHFPRLERVVLKHCTSLEEIPHGLGEVSALQNMEIYWPTPAAAASARRIQQQKQQVPRLVDNKFKLHIYPPDV